MPSAGDLIINGKTQHALIKYGDQKDGSQSAVAIFATVFDPILGS